MKPGIDWYKYGTVTKIDAQKGYIDLTILVEDTKADLIVSMSNREVSTWDEVEFVIGIEKSDIGEETSTILGRHNISKGIKDKFHEKILFPTEVGFTQTRKEREEIDLQKMHMLVGKSKWMQKLYDTYTELVSLGTSTWWARDPFNPKAFNSTKLFMTNARNVFFFYCVEKAKAMIREQFYESWLDQSLFESYIHEYYALFITLIKEIPLPYETVVEFESRFADIKYEVGL